MEIKEERIPALLFMDDVLSIAEGYEQQRAALKTVREFGLKHQLEWGLDKCKVMEIGAGRKQKEEWKLGDDMIENCESYKYLGEQITANGKNEENLTARFQKVKNTVRADYPKRPPQQQSFSQLDLFMLLSGCI